MRPPVQHPQLTLGIQLKDSASFANYFAAGNAEAVAHLSACAWGEGEHAIFLWGAAGCGKTHLLQAVCHEAMSHGPRGSRGVRPVYLPLEDAQHWQPEILDDLENCALICLDNIHAIAGLTAWEEALFHLYNRVREAGQRLLVSARTSPAQLNLQLPDLASRLVWGLTIHIETLNEADKIAALQLCAQQRGFELPTDVAQFLLRRCPRDTTSLFALLDRLDHASLAAQRKLTIPFVRELI